jgi:hypothetical protein
MSTCMEMSSSDGRDTVDTGCWLSGLIGNMFVRGQRTRDKDTSSAKRKRDGTATQSSQSPQVTRGHTVSNLTSAANTPLATLRTTLPLSRSRCDYKTGPVTSTAIPIHAVCEDRGRITSTPKLGTFHSFVSPAVFEARTNRSISWYL